jgi:hypothetical protein
LDFEDPDHMSDLVENYARASGMLELLTPGNALAQEEDK